MLLWPVTSIEFDTMNKTPWYSINGSRTIRSAFQVNTKRLHGDQFLNVHNPAATFVFSCNTNVQVGEIDHMYYTTLYGSKFTQKEDTQSFTNVSNALARRMNKKVQKGELYIKDSSQDPDFIEGIC